VNISTIEFVSDWSAAGIGLFPQCVCIVAMGQRQTLVALTPEGLELLRSLVMCTRRRTCQLVSQSCGSILQRMQKELFRTVAVLHIFYQM
jgi:hypothetical protein